MRNHANWAEPTRWEVLTNHRKTGKSEIWGQFGPGRSEPAEGHFSEEVKKVKEKKRRKKQNQREKP